MIPTITPRRSDREETDRFIREQINISVQIFNSQYEVQAEGIN